MSNKIIKSDELNQIRIETRKGNILKFEDWVSDRYVGWLLIGFLLAFVLFLVAPLNASPIASQLCANSNARLVTFGYNPFGNNFNSIICRSYFGTLIELIP